MLLLQAKAEIDTRGHTWFYQREVRLPRLPAFTASYPTNSKKTILQYFFRTKAGFTVISVTDQACGYFGDVPALETGAFQFIGAGLAFTLASSDR